MNSPASSSTARATSSPETVPENSVTNSPVSESTHSVNDKEPWRPNKEEAAADYKNLYKGFPEPDKEPPNKHAIKWAEMLAIKQNGPMSTQEMYAFFIDNFRRERWSTGTHLYQDIIMKSWKQSVRAKLSGEKLYDSGAKLLPGEVAPAAADPKTHPSNPRYTTKLFFNDSGDPNSVHGKWSVNPKVDIDVTLKKYKSWFDTEREQPRSKEELMHQDCLPDPPSSSRGSSVPQPATPPKGKGKKRAASDIGKATAKKPRTQPKPRSTKVAVSTPNDGDYGSPSPPTPVVLKRGPPPLGRSPPKPYNTNVAVGAPNGEDYGSPPPPRPVAPGRTPLPFGRPIKSEPLVNSNAPEAQSNTSYASPEPIIRSASATPVQESSAHIRTPLRQIYNLGLALYPRTGRSPSTPQLPQIETNGLNEWQCGLLKRLQSVVTLVERDEVLKEYMWSPMELRSLRFEAVLHKHFPISNYQ